MFFIPIFFLFALSTLIAAAVAVVNLILGKRSLHSTPNQEKPESRID